MDTSFSETVVSERELYLERQRIAFNPRVYISILNSKSEKNFIQTRIQENDISAILSDVVESHLNILPVKRIIRNSTLLDFYEEKNDFSFLSEALKAKEAGNYSQPEKLVVYIL